MEGYSNAINEMIAKIYLPSTNINDFLSQLSNPPLTVKSIELNREKTNKMHI
jgi:hypothetical protein